MDAGHFNAGIFMYQTNQNMRVLMFGWELPPYNTGGLGVACYGLARGLSHQGVGVSFALPRQLPINVDFMNILSHDLHGVDVTAINSPMYTYMDAVDYCNSTATMREERLRIYGKSLYDEAVRFGQMAAAWSEAQPHEVIHSHDWMTYPAGMSAKKVSGKPWVAHVHATEYDRTGGRVNSQIAEMEYVGLNKADKVIAVSNYTKDMVHQYYSVPKEKIVVVHNGVDMEEFSPVDFRRIFPDDKVVLYVGRLTMQKGVEYLLKAAKKVLEEKPNTIFVIAGNGDLEYKLMMDAAYMGIGHRVVFPGFLSGEKLRACYQMADVFVMPSVSEPYGIVALEAIANGTPAIISKQSGVSETMNNVMKVDFWDTEKMAKMMLTVLDYPQMASEMARLAKREAATMTWDKAAGQVLQVYQDLAG